MPRLSIIVTTYNIENYLEECLQGVVDQTLEDIEIIVVDDGSTDSTPDIIERFAARDPRIVPVLLEENTVGGVATAANTGLDHATADYVGFADGDDVYSPDMFEKLLAAAETHDTDLAMCQYHLLSDEDGSLELPADATRWDELHADSYRLDVGTSKQFLRFIAVPWRKIYRRSMLETHGVRFPVGDYFYEDNPFHWFAILSSNSIAVVPESLCQHRVGRLGQTMATVDSRLFKIFAHHETIHDWLVEQDLDAEYSTTLLAWAMSQSEWISRRTPPELRRELFDTLRTVYAHYDRATVEAALSEGRKGVTTRQLAFAIMTDNFASFDHLLDHQGEPAKPLTKIAYHVRHSGVQRTAVIAARYARNQVRRAYRRSGLRDRVAAGFTKSQDDGTSIQNSDLMMALMVLEQRLDTIEETLGDLPKDPTRG